MRRGGTYIACNDTQKYLKKNDEWQIPTDNLLFIGNMLQDQQAAEAFGIPFQHAFDIHAQGLH